VIDRSTVHESSRTLEPRSESRACSTVGFRLRAFGGLVVEGPDGPLAGRIAHRHPLALLALLAAGCDGRCTRDKVIGYLWGECDEQRARHALADTLYILRRTLGSGVVRSIGSSLQLDTGVLWTDVGAFGAAVERGDLEGAVELYRGTFLDGFHLQGAPGFEQWLDSKRQYFERMCGEALLALAGHAESHGDYDRAIGWWRQAVAHSPYDAQAALRLCEAFAAIGDRAEAFRTLLDYEHRLQRDLGIEPDGAVTAVKESLLSHQNGTDHTAERLARPPRTASAPATNGTAASTPPTVADAESAVVLRGRRRLVGTVLGLAAVASAVAVGAFRTLRLPTAGSLDPDQIVVAAFDRVSDAVDTVIASGLARLVSLSLDGAGPLRSVPPPRLRTGDRARGDHGSAQRIARASGAGLVLFANLSPVGRDSLSVSAVLYDATAGQQLATFEVRGEYRDPRPLADRLAVLVMEELAGRRQFGAWHLSSVGSTSPAAVREFLRAEWHLRHFQLDSARLYYERAIAADSGFALAYRGLNEAESSQSQIPGDYPELALRAGELNHGLALRESLLLTADSLFGAVATYGLRSPPPALVRRLLLTLGDWTEAYPRDPEAWYRLGDAAYHLEMLAGMSYRDARDAFTRAIEIDSGYAPPYVHKIELDVALEGPATALETVHAYLALGPDEPWARALRIVADLLAPDRASSPETARALDSLATEAHPRYLPQDPATLSLLLANRLVMWSVAPGAPGVRVARVWRYPNAVALAAAYRGHLAEAYAAFTGDEDPWRIPGSSRDAFFAALARLGAAPRDTAAHEFARWLDARYGWGVYNALPSWSDSRDTVSLRRAVVFFDSLAHDTLESRASLGRYGTAAARAYVALAHGDSASVLTRLSGLAPWCWAPECYHEVLTLARVFVRLGRDREALAAFARIPTPMHLPPSPGVVLVAYERGQVEERLERRAEAARSYRYVVEAWHDADPVLGRFVDGARDGLRRLSAGKHPPLP
jgi:DNA-binding SARP family transcriptional activator